MADLSVIIVNYNSGLFCANFIDSLLDQDFKSPDGKKGEMEIIVVDNVSPDDQTAFLTPLEAKGVKIVYSKENLGYAGGCNLGMESVNSDYIMVANPDVVLMPGSLDKMMKVIYSDPKIGIVGPGGWLDPGFQFSLPPVELPTLRSHLKESLGRIRPATCRSYSLTRSRSALRYWAGNGAIKADVICGYCAIMPYHLAKELGPFDTKFPLYYEDVDLSFRATKAGYSLLYVTGAPAIHFYNKSAGPLYEEVIHKYDFSKSYFFRKHYGAMAHMLYRLSTNYIKKRIGKLKGSLFEEFIDLGQLHKAPSIEIPVNQQVLIEITLDPSFNLAVGRLHEGGSYTIPKITWESMDGSNYYLRILDKTTGKTLKAYKLHKTTPAAAPPPYADLKKSFPCS